MGEACTTEQVVADIAAQVEKNKLPPLLHRDFVVMNSELAGEVIRVMQWNMLAQGKVERKVNNLHFCC